MGGIAGKCGKAKSHAREVALPAKVMRGQRRNEHASRIQHIHQQRARDCTDSLRQQRWSFGRLGDNGPEMGSPGALARDSEAVGRTEHKTTWPSQKALQQEAPVGPERELVKLKPSGGDRTYASATVSFPSLHRSEWQEPEC